MQHGEDRGRPGGDAGRRQVAAQGGYGAHTGRRRPARLHARRGQRLPDVHGRRVRGARRERRLLQAGRAHQDRQRRRQVAAGPVGRMPPGDPRPGRAGGELHPAGRVPGRVHRLRHGPRQLPGGGQDGYLQRGSGNGTPFAAFAGYTTALAGYVSVFNPVSPTVKDTMAGASACYHPGTEDRTARARCSARTPRVDVAHDLRPCQPVRFGGLRAGPGRELPVGAGDGQTVKQPKSGKGGKRATAATAATARKRRPGHASGGNGDRERRRPAGNGNGGESAARQPPDLDDNALISARPG